MKLVKVGGSVIEADVSTVTLDNVFTTDYDDYVIYCTQFGGTGSSINMRLLDSSGNEQSDSKYDFHQIYFGSDSINYQRSNNQNRVYDFFWKADNSSYKAYIFSPMVATQTRAISEGITEGATAVMIGMTYTDNTEQHRGIKFYQQGASDAFDEGAIIVYGIKQ
jgi:hypothetical protein